MDFFASLFLCAPRGVFTLLTLFVELFVDTENDIKKLSYKVETYNKSGTTSRTFPKVSVFTMTESRKRIRSDDDDSGLQMKFYVTERLANQKNGKVMQGIYRKYDS